MKFVALLAVVTALVGSMGCVVTDQMSDEQLATNVKVAARESVFYGLKLAAKKTEDPAKVLADAQFAKKLITENVLPAFTGASTGDVLRAAVDAALAQLSGKLSPTLVDVIQLAVNLVASQVNLPSNPVEKLDARTVGALVGLFTGINEGVDKFEASLATAPAPASDTAARKVIASNPRPTLAWPTR